MHRLEKFAIVVGCSLVSKSFLFANKNIKLERLLLSAGLYRLTSVVLEHALMLSSLTGVLAILKSQQHGKKRKRTVSFNASVTGLLAWKALDKLLHEFLPKLNDFKSLKLRRQASYSFTVRFKQKITPLVDFEELVDVSMYDKNKGVFLPVTAHFHLGGRTRYPQISEHYLRMLRLPFTFYTRRKAPAFDDSVTFA